MAGQEEILPLEKNDASPSFNTDLALVDIIASILYKAN